MRLRARRLPNGTMRSRFTKLQVTGMDHLDTNEGCSTPNRGRCDFVHPTTGKSCQFGEDEQPFTIDRRTHCVWHLPQSCKEQWSPAERASFRGRLDAYLDVCEQKKLCAQLAGVVFCDNDFAGRVLQDADFWCAHFLEPANFQSTLFIERPKFFDARFENDALFESARIVEGASFNRTRFMRPATFKGRSPDTRLDTEPSTRGKPTYSWRDVAFFESVSFEGRRFNGPVDFTNALFAAAPNFKSCVFAASVLFPPINSFLDKKSTHASAAYHELVLAAVRFNWSATYKTMFRSLEAESRHNAALPNRHA